MSTTTPWFLGTLCLVIASPSWALPLAPTAVTFDTIDKTYDTPKCTTYQLFWDHPNRSEVAHYRVYRDGFAHNTVNASPFRGGASPTPATMQPNTSYTFRVAAIDHDGNEGPLSPESVLTTGPCEAADEVRIYLALVRFHDWQDFEYLPPGWSPEVARQDYLRTTSPNGPMSFFDWWSTSTNGRSRMEVTVSDHEVILPGIMTDYCDGVSSGNTDGSAPGLFCNLGRISADYRAVSGRPRGDEHAIALMVTGMQTAGVAGGDTLWISAHFSHHDMRRPDVWPWRILAHEIGHGFGLLHGFGTSGCDYPRDLLDVRGTCRHYVYHSHDAMGANDGSFTAEDRRRMGFLLPTENVQITPDSGSRDLTLTRLNSPFSGLKQLMFQGTGPGFFKDTWFTAEYRSGTGIDTKIERGVYVYLRPAPENRAWGDAGMVQLLDIKLTETHPSFDMPEHGVSLRLLGQNDEEARVRVDYGPTPDPEPEPEPEPEPDPAPEPEADTSVRSGTWHRLQGSPGGREQFAFCGSHGGRKKVWTYGGTANFEEPSMYSSEGLYYHVAEVPTWFYPSRAPGPGPRFGAACWVDSQDRVWVFGGEDGSTYFDDLWVFDPRLRTWRQASPRNPPGPLAHAAYLRDNDRRLWLVGGRRADGATADALWKLNVEVAPPEFTQLSTTGCTDCPEQKTHVAMAMTGARNLMAFGGANAAGEPSGALWKFRVADRRWKLRTEHGPNTPTAQGGRLSPRYSPIPRVAARLVRADDNSFYLFGGQSRTGTLADLWLFRSRQWARLDPAGNVVPTYDTTIEDLPPHLGPQPWPGARAHHGMWAGDGQIKLYGGHSPGQTSGVSQTTWIYELPQTNLLLPATRIAP